MLQEKGGCSILGNNRPDNGSWLYLYRKKGSFASRKTTYITAHYKTNRIILEYYNIIRKQSIYSLDMHLKF